MTQERAGRRGFVFPVRVTPEERAELEALHASTAGPRGLGPWLLWAAKRASAGGVLPSRGAGVLPARGPNPARAGITRAREPGLVLPRPSSRVILDLCAGSGSWSEPYRAAGYDVRRVDINRMPMAVGDVDGGDVRTMFAPDEPIWGVLAAPPCTEFSIAKNGHPRDFRAGLEVVGACTRIILACRPRWWALENPTGYLSQFLGTPRDVWEPYEFGDPWTKRTAIWGDFKLPERGPFVEPIGSAMDRKTAAERAITPPGFARAFFEANP